MSNDELIQNVEDSQENSNPADPSRRRFLVGAAATAAVGVGLTAGAPAVHAEGHGDNQEFEGRTAFITGGRVASVSPSLKP